MPWKGCSLLWGSVRLVLSYHWFFVQLGLKILQLKWSDQSSAERICWREGCELLLGRENR